jgi:hypothetical protein
MVEQVLLNNEDIKERIEDIYKDRLGRARWKGAAKSPKRHFEVLKSCHEETPVNKARFQSIFETAA